MIEKLSDRVYLTPNGIVDFNAKQELSESQKMHNSLVDFEFEMAEREFQHREKMAKLTGTINVIGRRKIIALKYV